MKSIFLKKISIMIILLAIITACSAKTDEKSDSGTNVQTESKENIIENKKTEPDQQEKPNQDIKPQEDMDKNNADADISTEEPKQESKQEEQKEPKQEKPVSEFGKLDNTKYGWWYRRNKDQPPTIDKKYYDLLKKYDGIFRHETDEKVLYLTFDEGYENGYTPKILDVLKENQTPAAFFITGPYLKKHSDLVKRMVDEGHIVANHTINHPSMPEVLDNSKLEEEILGLERPFYEMFQKNMKYIRPPKGEYSERTLALTQSLGYKSVFWSFHYLDYDVKKQKGADHAYNEVMTRLHNGSVLLLHAVSKDNAEALDRIIKDAKAQGYEFKSLDEID